MGCYLTLIIWHGLYHSIPYTVLLILDTGPNCPKCVYDAGTFLLKMLVKCGYSGGLPGPLCGYLPPVKANTANLLSACTEHL
jgi:hypothetical protein